MEADRSSRESPELDHANEVDHQFAQNKAHLPLEMYSFTGGHPPFGSASTPCPWRSGLKSSGLRTIHLLCVVCSPVGSVALGEQAGCRLPIPVDFPCDHQKLQLVSTLLLEGWHHGQQSSLAEPNLLGLDAIAEFLVDHRRSERSSSCGEDFLYGGVGPWRHQLRVLQVCPQRWPHFEHLAAGANGGSPGCLLPFGESQVAYLFQLRLKGLANRG